MIRPWSRNTTRSASRWSRGGGDDEGRAVLAQPVDRLLHPRLGFDVERAGRFIEDQDRSVLQDSAGNRDTLALAARQAVTAFTDMRVVADHAAFDEVGRRRCLGCLDDLFFSRILAAEPDVVLDRAVQQARVLEDSCYCVAQRLAGYFGDVLSIDQDLPRLRLVDPLQEVDERGLAGARRPDDGDRLARLTAKDTSRTPWVVDAKSKQTSRNSTSPRTFLSSVAPARSSRSWTASSRR